MKAIILAAGQGRRLYPLTKDIPKALIEIEGKMLITRMLEALKEAGLKDSDIILLTGHGAEKLKAAAPGCRFIHNQVYDSTNNIYSLWLARKHLAGKVFLLLNCDVLFAPPLLDRLLDSEECPNLMIDRLKPLGQEEMKVKVNDKGRITAISKQLEPSGSQGEYIGLARFDKRFSGALFDRITRMLGEGGKDLWYEHAINHLLDSHPLYATFTQGLPWIEIDTRGDLELATEVATNIDYMEA